MDNPIQNILSLNANILKDKETGEDYSIVFAIKKKFYLKLFKISPELEYRKRFSLINKKDIEIFLLKTSSLNKSDFKTQGCSSLDEFVDSNKGIFLEDFISEAKFSFNLNNYSYFDMKFNPKYKFMNEQNISLPMPTEILYEQLRHYKKSGFLNACL